jgi:putative oxidoreductase
VLPSSLKRSASFGLRLLVAGLFVYAAVQKIRDPASFAEQTGNYQFFPELANFIAVALPSVEILCALTLLVGKRHWRDAAAFTLVLMLIVFSTAIARAWAIGLNLECGCFGLGSAHVGPWPLLRNFALVLALAAEFWLDRPPTSSRVAESSNCPT